jgi:cell division protein FtsL
MSFRVSGIISMMCFAIAAFGLYIVKYAVQDVQRDVTTLQTEVKDERESLHLLNAEWAYLNRPERLHALADKHLDLQPLDSRKIQDVGVLPAAYVDEVR